MKKKSILLLLMGILLACLAAVAIFALRREPKLDRNEMVTVYCISEIRYARGDQEPEISHTMEYDAFGNMISCTKYSSMVNDDRSETYYYEYDQLGNCVWCTYGEEREQVCVYDEEDRLLQKTTYWSGSVHEEITYAYDEAGRKVKYGWLIRGKYRETLYDYDAEGRLLTETYTSGEYEEIKRYTYDFWGNKTRVDVIENGEQDCTISYTYNWQGKMLSHVVEYVGEAPQVAKKNYAEYFQYDIWGNEISYQGYQYDRLQEERIRTYDLWGRVETERNYENGRLTSSARYTYDLRGNVIRIQGMAGAEMYIDSPGEPRPLLITYQYDWRGRMIQRVKQQEYFGTETHTWAFDRQGNLLEEEYRGRKIIRTYDQWGNILSRRVVSREGRVEETFFTYVSFQVPRWMAEKIMAQQEEYLDRDGMVLFG